MRFYEFLQQQHKKEIYCKREEDIIPFLTEQLTLRSGNTPRQSDVVRIMFNTLDEIKSDVNLAAIFDRAISGFSEVELNLNSVLFQIYFSIIYNDKLC